MNKTWKNVEREVCRYLGCERTGPVGKEGPDCDCIALAVQVKHRENIPNWLKTMVRQTKAQATSGPPLLVLHPYGAPIEESLAILTLRDARNLLLAAGMIHGIMNEFPETGKEEVDGYHS